MKIRFLTNWKKKIKDPRRIEISKFITEEGKK